MGIFGHQIGNGWQNGDSGRIHDGNRFASLLIIVEILVYGTCCMHIKGIKALIQSKGKNKF
jgi:hypothetical protein